MPYVDVIRKNISIERPGARATVQGHSVIEIAFEAQIPNWPRLS